ncbi:MAG: hypothetical protein K0S99_3611 [Thermomicrobiales bacterium]|nr:hypothetical protein [Thermomicrobiales bacterium]
MTDRDAGPLEKRRPLHASRRGLVAGAVAALAARRGWGARAQDRPAVVYECATVNTIFGQA